MCASTGSWLNQRIFSQNLKKCAKMFLSVTTFFVFLLFLALGSTNAYKDDSYYMANTGNPNVDRKMYWKEIRNIVQDLDQFSALYVEFHDCVWSTMNYAETHDDIDENDYWYMGSVPAMGANVAFSLYGSLVADEGEKGVTGGCTEDTFINSFYTKDGFNAFTAAMYHAGLSEFANFTYMNAHCQYESGSHYAVGCDSSYGFAIHAYSSSTCDPRDFVSRYDTLDVLNQAMSSVECVEVFRGEGTYGYASSYGGGGGYSSSNVSYYETNSYASESVSGTSLELLLNSTPCNYMNFYSPYGYCPDPYGMIESYVETYREGIYEKKKGRMDPFTRFEEIKAQSLKEIHNGIYLYVAACLILICYELRRYISKFLTYIGIQSLLKKIVQWIKVETEKLFQDKKGGTSSQGTKNKKEKKKKKKTKKKNKTSVPEEVSNATEKSVDEENGLQNENSEPYILKKYETETKDKTRRSKGTDEANSTNNVPKEPSKSSEKAKDGENIAQSKNSGDSKPLESETAGETENENTGKHNNTAAFSASIKEKRAAPLVPEDTKDRKSGGSDADKDETAATTNVQTATEEKDHRIITPPIEDDSSVAESAKSTLTDRVLGFAAAVGSISNK